jgi:hypothetical protein
LKEGSRGRRSEDAHRILLSKLPTPIQSRLFRITGGPEINPEVPSKPGFPKVRFGSSQFPKSRIVGTDHQHGCRSLPLSRLLNDQLSVKEHQEPDAHLFKSADHNFTSRLSDFFNGQIYCSGLDAPQSPKAGPRSTGWSLEGSIAGSGLAPHDSFLVFRDISTQEIYTLETKWPSDT